MNKISERRNDFFKLKSYLVSKNIPMSFCIASGRGENKILVDENGEILENLSSAHFYNDITRHAIKVYLASRDGEISMVYVQQDEQGKMFNFITDDAAAVLNNRYCYSIDYATEKGPCCNKKFTLLNNNMDFIDYMFKLKTYGSISLGKNRFERELVVMDIDTDVELLGAQYSKLLDKLETLQCQPTFICKNNKNNHVQLQWVLREPIQYCTPYTLKEYSNHNNPLKDYKTGIYKRLFNQCKGVQSERTELGDTYLFVCRNINNIEEDGIDADTAFTAARCKNAFTGAYHTEVFDHEVQYRMNDNRYYIMDELAIKKFNNKQYRKDLKKYDSTELLDTLSTLCKVKDISEIQTTRHASKLYNDNHSCSTDEHDSRNDYVFNHSINVAVDLIRSNYTYYHSNIDVFKNAVYDRVKLDYENRNIEYQYSWPGTKKHGGFTDKEFTNNCFSAVQYIFEHHNPNAGMYTNEQREYSLLYKRWKMMQKLACIRYSQRVQPNATRKEISTYIKNKTGIDIKISYISDPKNKKFLNWSDAKFIKKYNQVKQLFIWKSQRRIDCKPYIFSILNNNIEKWITSQIEHMIEYSHGIIYQEIENSMLDGYSEIKEHELYNKGPT